MNITATELRKILNIIPPEQNILLIGRHGIGKSEIITSFYEEKGLPVVTLFLGQMSDPGDLIGLLRPDEKSDRSIFMPPAWFPVDGKPIVLFLDELNRARPEVLQTVMDLVLNKKLAGRSLPQGSRIVSAVNDGDEYQLTELDPALVSRFNVYRFLPTVNDWIQWANSKELDKRVINFIRENPQLLEAPIDEIARSQNLTKHPDRRSWARVGILLKGIEQIDEFHIKILSGIVGLRAATRFAAFDSGVKTISAERLLSDFKSVKTVLTKMELHQIAALNISICDFIETEHLEAEQEKVYADGLMQYIKWLQKSKKQEALAQFADQLTGNIYPELVQFLLRNTPEIYSSLLKFIRDF